MGGSCKGNASLLVVFYWDRWYIMFMWAYVVWQFENSIFSKQHACFPNEVPPVCFTSLTPGSGVELCSSWVLCFSQSCGVSGPLYFRRSLEKCVILAPRSNVKYPLDILSAPRPLSLTDLSVSSLKWFVNEVSGFSTISKLLGQNHQELCGPCHHS